MTQEPTKQGSPRTTVMTVGAVAAMVLCCVGPILLAGGALAAVGGFLSSPLVVLSGLGLVGAGVVMFLRRRTGSTTDPSCCPPRVDQSPDTFDAATTPRRTPGTDRR
jgi:hypothetical protein